MIDAIWAIPFMGVIELMGAFGSGELFEGDLPPVSTSPFDRAGRNRETPERELRGADVRLAFSTSLSFPAETFLEAWFEFLLAALELVNSSHKVRKEHRVHRQLMQKPFIQ
jgi:hypothetical protein